MVHIAHTRTGQSFHPTCVVPFERASDPEVVARIERALLDRHGCVCWPPVWTDTHGNSEDFSDESHPHPRVRPQRGNEAPVSNPGAALGLDTGAWVQSVSNPGAALGLDTGAHVQSVSNPSAALGLDTGARVQSVPNPGAALP